MKEKRWKNESKNSEFVNNLLFFFINKHKNVWKWKMRTICDKNQKTIKKKIKIILINMYILYYTLFYVLLFINIKCCVVKEIKVYLI